MRSSRLAALAVAAGTALLGWSTAGVTAIGGKLAAASPADRQQQQQQQLWPGRHHHDDVDFTRGGHDRRPGV
jgi:hypothetical protein